MLEERTGLSQQMIKVWFQNARNKMRQKDVLEQHEQGGEQEVREEILWQLLCCIKSVILQLPLGLTQDRIQKILIISRLILEIEIR